MKKCTKFHNNKPSDARVCTYCGNPQQESKQMQRQPKRKETRLY